MDPDGRADFTREVQHRAEQLVGDSLDSDAFKAFARWLLEYPLGPGAAQDAEHHSSVSVWDRSSDRGSTLILNRSAQWSDDPSDGTLPSWTVECRLLLEEGESGSVLPDGILGWPSGGSAPFIKAARTEAADVV